MARRRDEDAWRKRDAELRRAREQRDEQRRHEDALLEEQMRRDQIAARAIWQRHGAVDPEITRRLAAMDELREASRREQQQREAARIEGARAIAEQQRLAAEEVALRGIERQRLDQQIRDRANRPNR